MSKVFKKRIFDFLLISVSLFIFMHIPQVHSKGSVICTHSITNFTDDNITWLQEKITPVELSYGLKYEWIKISTIKAHSTEIMDKCYEDKTISQNADTSYQALAKDGTWEINNVSKKLSITPASNNVLFIYGAEYKKEYYALIVDNCVLTDVDCRHILDKQYIYIYGGGDDYYLCRWEEKWPNIFYVYADIYIYKDSAGYKAVFRCQGMPAPPK